MSRFSQALATLLPTGYAWPRTPDSTWMRLLEGLAGSFEELHDGTGQAAREWLPHATRTRLAEWEEACGLPDPCFGADQTTAVRQAAVLARLRRPDGAYADSGSATLATIEAAVAQLGYTATAHYNTRMRCGRDRVGRRVGRTDGKLYVVVVDTGVDFSVGVDRVGTRLVTRPNSAAQIACAIEGLVPARFEINVIFF